MCSAETESETYLHTSRGGALLVRIHILPHKGVRRVRVVVASTIVEYLTDLDISAGCGMGVHLADELLVIADTLEDHARVDKAEVVLDTLGQMDIECASEGPCLTTGHVQSSSRLSTSNLTFG